MKKLLILGIACLGFIPMNAQEGYHKHDGFYLSLSLGGSSGSISDKMTTTTTFDGTGGALDLKIGGAIKENLILHANISSIAITGPTLTENGSSVKATDETSIGQAMLGVGLTYYIMPSNFFISGSVGSGNFSSIINNKTTSSNHGPSFQLKVGKEWWVSKNWGLGIAALLNTTNVDNTMNGIAEKVSGTQFGVLFNATFN